MGLRKRNKDNDDPIITLGRKIKAYRELRGMTQKELGMKCGFSPETADVRISQYENDQKIPKDAVLESIADALKIDKEAFYSLDISNVSRVCHILFDLGLSYGFHPVKKDGAYYLSLNENDAKGWNDKNIDFYLFMKQWSEVAEDCTHRETDTKEEKEIKSQRYTAWGGEFPHDYTLEEIRDGQNKKRNALQNEIDGLTTKLYASETMKRINEVVKETMPSFTPKIENFHKVSDFCIRMMAAMECGLEIDFLRDIGMIVENLRAYFQVFSIKVDSIMQTNATKNHFTELSYYIDRIREFGVRIISDIRARKNELWIDYYVESERYACFNRIRNLWDEMSGVIKCARYGEYHDPQYKERRLRIEQEIFDSAKDMDFRKKYDPNKNY